MTAQAIDDPSTHQCNIKTIRPNFRNPAEVICIKCFNKHPCEHFGLEPLVMRPRELEEVIIMPETASILPSCTLELYNPKTKTGIWRTICGGDIEPTHQGWIFNSRCKECGQPYLNLNARLFIELLQLDLLS